MAEIGIEIGGTKLQIAIGNSSDSSIRQLHRFTVDCERGAAGILEQIEATLRALPEKLEAVGIGFGGPVHRLKGTVATSHQVGGWSGFELVSWFREQFHITKVFLENDANAAALSEALYGVGEGFEKMFYITLGSGVGGGMVVNQRLYYGAEPGEAEVGQMRLDRLGNTLESYCSGWALDRKIRARLPVLPEASILRKLAGTVTSGETRFLPAALEQGDVEAQAIFDEYTDTLAWGLSHVTHLFNPQVIVLGGGVSLVGEPLRVAVANKINRYLANAFHPGPAIRLSSLQEKAVPAGALALIRQAGLYA